MLWRIAILVLVAMPVLADDVPGTERVKAAQDRLDERQRQREEADAKPVTQAEFRKIIRELHDEIDDLRKTVAQLRQQATPPKPAAPSDEITRAIREGKPAVGMTKDQVEKALPKLRSNVKYVRDGLESTEWGPPTGRGDELFRVDYTIVFAGGKVRDIFFHDRQSGRAVEVNPNRTDLKR